MDPEHCRLSERNPARKNPQQILIFGKSLGGPSAVGGPRTTGSAVEEGGGDYLHACLIVTMFYQEQRLLREDSEKIVFCDGDFGIIGI
jgi:hypothetical protein